MKCGIYQIKNQINNKIYIGSSKNIENRWKQHIKSLNKEKHYNKYLQRAWNKYNYNNFEFIILEECLESELFIKEKIWIDKLNPEYNIGSVGGGDCTSNNVIYQKWLKNLTPVERKEIWGKNKKGKLHPNWKGGLPKCKNCNKKLTNYGNFRCKKCSNKYRNKPSNSNPVYIDGIFYSSQADAAKALGISTKVMCMRLKNLNKYPEYKKLI